MIRIEIDDREVRQALAELQRRVGDMTPAMREIGDVLAQSTIDRFKASTAPDGSRWAPNSPATILSYLQGKSGAFSKRDGRLTKKGAAVVMKKKPLIGETKSLSSKFSHRADRASVEVFSTVKYAATHQIGAKKGEYGRTRRGAPIPWGDIPARPFMGLSESDKRSVLEIIEEHLAG